MKNWLIRTGATVLLAGLASQGLAQEDKPEPGDEQAQKTTKTDDAQKATKDRLNEVRSNLRKAEEEAQRAAAEVHKAREEFARTLMQLERAERRRPGPRTARYWIGVGCGPASPTLAAQLGLEDGQGLVVEDVVKDSPAAKAGVAENDVLAELGTRKLLSLEDLIEAVQDAEGKEVPVTLFRGGKSQTLKITPAERPDIQPFDFAGDGREFEIRLPEGRVQVVRPGVVFPAEKLPRELSIQISRTDDETARVIVNIDGKTYETTADDLEELPTSVREHVRALTGRRSVTARLIQPAPGMPPLPTWSHSSHSMESRLEEIQKTLERLQKSIEALQKEPTDKNSGAHFDASESVAGSGSVVTGKAP